MKVRLAIWAFTVLLVAACTEPIKEPGDIEGIGKIVPQPIPPRFDFPAARSTVQAWADGYEVERIRTHAWNIWAGMTADSASSHDGQLLPIWETWCGDEEVFSQTCGQADKPFRKFERPVQHAHLAKKKGRPSQEDTQVVSFNKFNPSMAEFTQTPHPGPGGKEYDYTDKSSLTALNAAWPPKTPIADRRRPTSLRRPITRDSQPWN